ncbi:SDR family NAD(P)-dependent oxidoreductase [Chryseobacterium sp. SC28]|uniref:SDR family NAD(P)-dependent oxidoreductase n=1 Tax=Chryseobacterium sp. SC28 TaxID=2268028 RepID=UPI000F6516E5|nr:SDR family oxidoreductase [Chryseobacterium sp. SC28]RRQ45176.1 SDR family NAD(P)-dependent oxidoreductase [Chryseobacterium sp. SC28]
MTRLANKVAVITGGSGAIGSTVAKLFLAEGAKVVIVDINEDALSKVASDLNSPNLSYIAADVTKASDVEKYAQHAVNTFGKIDVFFNNAGIEGVVKPLTEYPEDEFDKLINVNVKGVWLGLKYVLPQMNDGGSVINTSSVAGLMGTANMIAYTASKHAVIGITRTAALEAAPRGIRVNSVHPAPVDNRMMRSLEDGFAPGAGETVKKNFEASIPLGRYANNDDIAKGVLFLASDESQFITGSKLVIDGGMKMA